MKVFLTGANGFIGSYITAALLWDGHSVTAAVRKPEELLKRFPGLKAAKAVDMNTATSADHWSPLIRGMDAVINCAGVLQGSAKQNIWNIHHLSPAALFEACEKARVEKVIQISAISADREIGTAYALSKLAAEDDLRSRKLKWVVLRPSLVMAANAYGGTALLRKLASLPVIPLVGKGDQKFQLVMMDDLTKVVLNSLIRPKMNKVTLEVVGPEVFEVKDILIKLRAWSGKKPAPAISIPVGLVKMTSRLTDLFSLGPMRTTALKHMIYGNVGKQDALQRMRHLAGCKPGTFDDFLKANQPDNSGRHR
ncbi:MAG: NAD(P)H-binding protein [Proteobacteria bacterium]|nr:NAD(P)H-binding protein [Pseudomonadota bacterium]